MAQAPSFEFRSAIVDANAEIVTEARIAMPNPGGDDEGTLLTYPILIRHDVTTFPAGTYSLYVSFSLNGHQLSRVRAGSFSVAWDIRTWEVPRREYLAEARFLVGDEEYKLFEEKSVGEQEEILDKMWKAYDPTPETGINEAYEKFRVRMAYINAHYAEDAGPAIFSPRGQLYMRYGPPDELVQDVIPINKETISEAVEILADQYHTMNFSSHGGTKPYNRGANRDHVIDPHGVGRLNEGDNQGYPYELWVYLGRGDPILKRDEIQEMDIGMRYLFIDRNGYGRYILESSSTISTK
jgi:GWxTD domain-containing protein